MSTHRFTLILDVGANRGQFSLLARAFNPQARIVAFEPLPQAAHRYRELFANDSRVQLYQTALGPEISTAQLNISAQDDSSSLLNIGALQTSTFPGTERVNTTTVPIATLDTYVDKIWDFERSLLKLDVQGYELEILRGAERTLERITYVLVELNFVEFYDEQVLGYDVVKWLTERGFRVRHLEAPRWHDHQMLKVDAFLERIRPNSIP